MKAIDDGKGEDVTNGEGVNVKDLGDGEADDGDNNEGDLFFCHVIHHIPPLFHHDSLKLGVVSIFWSTLYYPQILAVGNLCHYLPQGILSSRILERPENTHNIQKCEMLFAGCFFVAAP